MWGTGAFARISVAVITAASRLHLGVFISAVGYEMLGVPLLLAANYLPSQNSDFLTALGKVFCVIGVLFAVADLVRVVIVSILGRQRTSA
ncbi:MAG: hypothetical protein ACRD3S_16120 [Terracidiphilus sp.]